MATDPQNRLGLGLVRQPATVVFGPGQRSQLPSAVRRIASKVLVVTDARMAGTGDFAEMMAGLTTAGVAVAIYGEALPDVPRSSIDEVVRRHGRGSDGPEVEAIVGIGGGSCLDLAKIVSVALTSEADVSDFYGEFRVPRPGVPVVTVPTTGGTGAEVTCIAVIFDETANMKVGVADPYLEPVVAIIDPELTLGCPPGLTAAVAADTLSHLVEAWTARAKNPSPEDLATKLYVGKNRITDVFAAKGLALVNAALERVVADPSDIDARADMMFAAYCAGMAINTTGTAAAHAIQAPIAAVSHAPHGFGVGALLPYVMRFNLPSRLAEFAGMGRILGVVDPRDPEIEQARAGIRRIERLLEIAGAPLNLKAIGVEPQHFTQIAASAMKATRLTVNNPRPMSETAVTEILSRGYADDRTWWDAA